VTWNGAATVWIPRLCGRSRKGGASAGWGGGGGCGDPNCKGCGGGFGWYGGEEYWEEGSWEEEDEEWDDEEEEDWDEEEDEEEFEDDTPAKVLEGQVGVGPRYLAQARPTSTSI
jgi:hypothetical protein